MSAIKRCDGVTRRSFLRVGGLIALGMGLGPWFHMQRMFASENKLQAKAKSCILIWLDGGPPHLDTFDPKPEALSEVRCVFNSIATRIPGVQISERLRSFPASRNHRLFGVSGRALGSSKPNQWTSVMSTVVSDRRVQAGTRLDIPVGDYHIPDWQLADPFSAPQITLLGLWTAYHDGLRQLKVEAAGIEPAGASSQPLASKQLTDSPSDLAAVWQRNQGSKCQCLTLNGTDASTDFEASIDYIRRAWPYLQPHIKEALFTLIDAALLGNQVGES